VHPCVQVRKESYVCACVRVHACMRMCVCARACVCVCVQGLPGRKGRRMATHQLNLPPRRLRQSLCLGRQLRLQPARLLLSGGTLALRAADLIVHAGTCDARGAALC